MSQRMTPAEVVAELRRRANELRKIAERPTAPQNQLRWRADALTDAADLVEQHLTPQVLDELDDGPMTPEEADRAYDEAEAVPISAERIAEVVQYVRTRDNRDRGELSENPGQLPAVGPQRAAPSSPAKIEAETRAARERLNNFGGGGR